MRVRAKSIFSWSSTEAYSNGENWLVKELHFPPEGANPSQRRVPHSMTEFRATTATVCVKYAWPGQAPAFQVASASHDVRCAASVFARATSFFFFSHIMGENRLAERLPELGNFFVRSQNDLIKIPRSCAASAVGRSSWHPEEFLCARVSSSGAKFHPERTHLQSKLDSSSKDTAEAS